MATAIFDLDHTLLNSEKLREELAKILGMTFDEYKESYLKYFTDEKVPYSFKNHLEILKKDPLLKNKPEIVNGEENFDKKFKAIDSLLYEGAIKLVDAEKEAGNKVLLMTFGNREWQEEKINRLSEIRNAFGENGIVYIDGDKSEILNEKIIPGEKYIIINDNIDETEKMVETLGRENCEVKIIASKYSAKEDAEMAGFKFYENVNDVLIEMYQKNNEIKNSFFNEKFLKAN